MDEQLTDEKSMPLPENKADLVERIAKARAALESVTTRLSDTQLVAPGPLDGWSVKDHLAHLAAWEAGIAALLRKEPRYPAMGFDAASPEDTDAVSAQRELDSDSLNAIIYERNQDRSLEDVRAYVRDAQDALSDALAQLDDADLRRMYSYYQPDEPGEDSGAPIVGWVAGNTYEHYAEHQAWIEALLG